MVIEKSCGAVVFTKINNQIMYLIIRNLSGTYGFPKGHMEVAEIEQQTALREVYEEVGICAKLIDGFKTEDNYVLLQKENTIKNVVYFLAEYSKQNVKIQREELLNAKLYTYDEAMNLFQYEGTKRVLKEANSFLLSYYKKDESECYI